MVISTVNRVVYNGDGITTAWPYTFRIIDATDIKLTIVDADGAETPITADYYVDTINNTVYYPGYAPGAEPPEADQPPKLQAGQKIIVYRQLPVNQLANLGEKWPFYVIEKGLDKLTMLIQDVWGWVGNNVVQRVGNVWDAKNLPIINVGGPVNVADAATKDYVDRILNGFVIAGDSRTVPFDNVDQMIAAEIEAGQIAFTLGYHDINDGGAGVYNIRAKVPGDVDDGGSIILLDNGNVAELITDGTVNVKQFGAKGGANYFDCVDTYYKSASGGSLAQYYNNTDGCYYASATFTTEGIYFKTADGKHYVDLGYTTEAPYYDSVNDKWYQTATYTDKANCFDVVGGNYYSGATLTDAVVYESEKIQNALNSGYDVNLQNDVYALSQQIILPSNIKVANGGFVLTDKDIVTIYANGKENITFDNVLISCALDTVLRGYYQATFEQCQHILFRKVKVYAYSLKSIAFKSCDDVTEVTCCYRYVKGTAILHGGCNNVFFDECIVDGENKTYQVNAWHMIDFDCHYDTRDSKNISVSNSMFLHHRSNGLQFTGYHADGLNYDIYNASVCNCKFVDYGSAALKIDGIYNSVTLIGNQIKNGNGGIMLSGGSGSAKNVIIEDCTFEDILAETITHLNRTTDVWDILRVINCTFKKCSTLDRFFIDITSSTFTEFEFSGNYVEECGNQIAKQSSGVGGHLIIKNNRFIKPVSATMWFNPNVDYCEIVGNYFDTPISYIASYEFCISGDSTGNLVRLENNIWVNSAKTNIYCTNTIGILFFNGNRMNGVVPTLGVAGTITEKVTYAVAP